MCCPYLIKVLGCLKMSAMQWQVICLQGKTRQDRIREKGEKGGYHDRHDVQSRFD